MVVDYDKYIYSTGTHYISNSGSDENKAYHGGKAGDQSGHEWELKAWYSRPWSVVLRYPDQTVALTIAKLSIDAPLNSNIGYDQYQRDTYWKELQKVNYDPAKIVTACEEDCTAGVSANVKAAGYIWGIKALQNLPLCSSRNMKQEFTNAGFQALTASKYLDSPNYLLPGDILLYESHHAACNITVGKNVRDTWKPDKYDTPNKQTEQTVIESSPTIPDKPYVLVTGSSVFVRKLPDTDHGSLGVVHADDKLPYLGFDYPTNSWHLVEYKGQTGWISNMYAHVVNP